jgi:CBS domain-containing protein
MQLKEIMTPGVEVIAPEATLQEAAEKMRHLDIGPLPVCDGDRLVGLLTDRDITVRAVAEGRNPATTQVREVMTPEVIYGYEEQDSQDAARLMEQYQIRRLPVLNHAKRLVGIVSLGDLAVHAGGNPWRAKCSSRSQRQENLGTNSRVRVRSRASGARPQTDGGGARARILVQTTGICPWSPARHSRAQLRQALALAP